MKQKNMWIVAGLASSLMALSAPSFATAVWSSATVPSPIPAGQFDCRSGGNRSGPCAVGNDGGTGATTLNVRAIADTGNNTASGTLLAAAYVGYYTGGFGVSRAAGQLTDSNFPNSGTEPYSTAPNHAMDNYGNQEWLLYTFGDDVTLTAVTLGWAGTDSDITVMAYEPTGLQPSVPVPANGSTTDSGATGLVSKGWVAIGNYMNVGTGTANISAASAGVSSSYWLIGAYNNLGGNNYNANGTACTSCADSSKDYVKVLSVAGMTSRIPPSGVPEPSSLLLAAIALVGLTALKRRRTV